jgi:hypothetical protein
VLLKINQLNINIMSQEELTLEHLSAYLPYGLKAKMSLCFDQQTIVEIVGLSFEFVELTGIRKTVSEHFELSDIKPILRPLSDLTKEIEHNEEKFVPMDVLYDDFRETDLLHFNPKNMFNQSYNLVQKLLEWHFDVFGLIDKGLAVSIHDVG